MAQQSRVVEEGKCKSVDPGFESRPVQLELASRDDSRRDGLDLVLRDRELDGDVLVTPEPVHPLLEAPELKSGIGDFVQMSNSSETIRVVFVVLSSGLRLSCTAFAKSFGKSTRWFRSLLSTN